MARVINASIPEDLSDVWNKYVEHYDGPSRFVQAMLKALQRAAIDPENPITERSVRQAFVAERVTLLEAQRALIEKELAELQKPYVAPPPPEPPKPAHPTFKRVVPTMEQWITERGHRLTGYADEELREHALMNHWDPDELVRSVRSVYPRRGAGA